MLKLTLDSLDGLDSAFHSLYTERNGKFHLTGVEGLKSQQDIDEIKGHLNKERDAHKQTKEKLQEYDDIRNLGLSPTDILSKLDRVEELEAASGDKIDEDKLEKMVETRIKSKLAPIERERDKAIQERDESRSMNEEYAKKEVTRTIHDNVQKAALEGKVVTTAIDDVLMLSERIFEVDDSGRVVTKDNVGVTPGVEAAVWLTDMQDKRPHWFPTSKGGGATGAGTGGAGGSNPFSHDGWNLTDQGKMVMENRSKAEQMAKAAGTSIGGMRPTKK